jgi:hypothetical protein
MLFQRIEPSNGSPAPMLGRVSWRTLAAMAVAFLPLFAPARVKADLTLGLAGQYTVFGNEVVLNGPPTVNGTVAVANNGSLSVSGGTFMGPVVLGNGASHTGSPVPNLTTGQNLTAASTAIATAATEAATAVSDAVSSHTLLTPGSPNGTSYTGVAGLNVIQITGNLTSAITLNGSSSSIFLVDVTGGVNYNGGGTKVNLGQNVSASNVLFYVTGSGGVNLGTNTTVSGSYLATNGGITIGGRTIVNGGLYDLTSMITDVTTESPLTINGTGNLFSGVVAAPEPAPLVKAISGLLTVGLWGFLRRKKRSK